METLTAEQREAVETGIGTIIAKCNALFILIDRADPEIVDRLMRDVASEANWVGAQCYKSLPRRRLIGPLVEVEHNACA